MPLSEVHKTTTQGKLENMQSKMSNYSSDLSSFMPDNEFVELLWENGQIVVQSQSNRQKKNLFNHPFVSHAGKAQEKDGSPKFGRFGAMDSMVNDLSPTVPSGVGLNTHDDEMAPWMNYPIEDTLQNEYCAEFLSEFSGVVDLNSVATDNGSMQADKHIGLGVGREYQNVEHGAASNRIRTAQLFHPSQQCQSSTMSSKLRAAELSNPGSSSALDTPSGDSLDKRSQRQDLPSSKTLQPGSGMGLMNFPHFSRPVVFAKANLQSADRLRSNEKASTTGIANPSDSTLINCSSGFRSSSAIQGSSASGPLDLLVRSSPNTPPNGVSIAQTEAIHREGVSRSKKNSGILAPDHSNHQKPVFVASMALGRHGMERAPEAVVASSVCSGNSAGVASSDLKHNTKRKIREGEETEYQSEDIEDESVGLKKPPPGRGTSAKRNRAAEVHNLSERRRRDRINERMRALQELIPNCNKVDKASMLDEAIEYLKTLQLQVQMMSMGSGLYMPSMMLPPGMQHIRAPPMAHYSPMGVGLGMGMGMGMGMGCRMGMLNMNGSPGCPLIPVPPMHGPQFPCPSIPGAPGLHGIPASAGLQMFGIHGRGLPVSMPRPPHINSFSLLPIRPNMAPEISAAATTTVPLTAAATAPSLSSKDQQHQSMKVEKAQKASTDDSLIQASIQETKEGAEQSTPLQMSDQGLHISGNGDIQENGARAT